MATFFNQATLSFRGSVVNSNTTEAELLSGLELTKTPITNSYSAGGGVVYTITLRNLGTTAYNGITLTDDLGAYTAPGGATAVPLDYVDGSLLYFVNGIPTPPPTVTTDTGALVLSGINIPQESAVTLIYEARTNEFAPIAVGSVITNTVTADGAECAEGLSASATVSVNAAPELTIAKAVCPAVANCNEPLTYTVIVQNLGNAPVVATDNVIISDVFNPKFTDITVTLDGAALIENTGYTYDAVTGEFATTEGTVTVPAATYTQDPVSGVITTTPGVAVLTVTGTV